MKMIKYLSPATVGRCLCNKIKQAADMYNLDYTEHKGWIESEFVFKGTCKDYLKMMKYMSNFQ